MSIEVLDPTYEAAATGFELAPRSERLGGLRIGVLSNGKHGTIPFFDALATELRLHHAVGEIVRVVKPNYSAPAGDDILDQARHWHALVAGVGD